MIKTLIGFILIVVAIFLGAYAWDNYEAESFININFKQIQIIFDVLIFVGIIYLIFFRK